MGTAQQLLIYGGATSSGVTWNPADKSANVTLSNGNLTATGGGSGDSQVRSTVSYSTGKYYFEVRLDAGPASSAPYLGIRQIAKAFSLGPGPFASGVDYGCFALSPNTGHEDYVPGSNVRAVGPALAVGDVYIFAVDFGTGKMWIGRNGTWDASGNPAAGTSASVTGFSGTHAAWCYVLNVTVTARFTRSAMTYTVPSGFLALDGT